MKSIRETTMLGSLSIGVWTARKQDKKVARKVENDASAKTGTISAAKHLLLGVQELEAVQANAAATRAWWSSISVPWFDNGPRVYNAAGHMELNMEMGDREREFRRLVREFLTVYPSVWAARQFDMGQLFDPKEYPSPAQVAAKFHFTWEFSALPASEDVRIIDALDEDEVAVMERAIEKRTTEKIGKAVEHAARRLYEVVNEMHKTMAVKIGEPGALFRNSKLENIIEIAEIMPTLNITNDPELAKLARMAKQLATKSPDELRNDEAKRAAAATEAKKLASQLAGMFSSSDDDEQEAA